MQPVLRTMWMALLLAVAMIGPACAHTQQPARTVYVISEDSDGAGSKAENGMGGAGADAYCNELQKQCYSKCWRRKPKLSSIEKGSGAHHEYCTSECLKAFMDCTKEQEELERQDAQSRKKELRFTDINKALGWLREHKAEATIGTIVIVGSAAAIPYAIVVLGGALVLAPL